MQDTESNIHSGYELDELIVTSPAYQVHSGLGSASEKGKSPGKQYASNKAG